MSMTIDQIVKESRRLPRDQISELFDRIGLALHGDIEPAVETAWNQEALRRFEEIENDKVQPIPGEKVMARMRERLGR
ncbi:addiction module antitoxin RelB [Opitutaceae bacterium TAV4]|nr:addiction module antitoxin RelB [Opitutaceae bacterium TAV4]RRK01699.1 addiction module antitoxin RelB [Opitutaceae bacterium TAV3]